MFIHSFKHFRDYLHAQLCYQLFITPMYLPLKKEHRDFAKKGCEFIEVKRSEVIHQEFPRHHVLHRFAQINNPQAKKILIAHGWMSRAAYMTRLIRSLHVQGYDVYALDFPAHGDAKGIQLLWTDAIQILRNTLNCHGPFYGAIGHSFGGSMLLTTINLAGQLPEWELINSPKRIVLIASPTRMRSPVKRIAKLFKLTEKGYLQLRHLIRHQAKIDPTLTRLHHFLAQEPAIPFLCIHGELDNTVSPEESLFFCKAYKYGHCALLPDADHLSVLIDERVEQLVNDFLS